MAKKSNQEAEAALAQAEANTLVGAEQLPTAMPSDVKQTVKVMMVKHTAIYHPYQRRWVPEAIDGPVEMVLDGWLESQIDAGLVKVVE